MRFLYLVFSLSILTFSLKAQVADEKVYTLQECINIAKEKNVDIAVQKSRISSAAADLTAAFGSYLPNIRYNLNYQRDLNPIARPAFINGQVIPNAVVEPNAFNMSASAQLAIFDGFNREANYQRAESNLESNQYSANQIEQDVTFQIYNNFISVARNKQVLQTRRENFSVGKQDLERIQAQFDAGVIAIAGVYAQESDLGEREIAIVNAQNELNISKANLLTIMGLNPIQRVEFDDSSFPDDISEQDILNYRKEIGSIEAAVQRATQTRYDLKASIENVEAASKSVSMSSSAYLPEVGFIGGWSWSNTEFSNFSDLGRSYIGLNLSVPIFQNFAVNRNVQQSRLQLIQAETQLFSLEQNLKSQIQNSMLNLEAAEKLLEITNRSIKSAQQNYNATSERIKVGAANITELTLANAQLINAKINRIDAVYNYILAQKQIEYSLGLIK